MNANFACVLSRPVCVLRDDFTSRGFEGRHVLMQGLTPAPYDPRRGHETGNSTWPSGGLHPKKSNACCC